MCTNELARINKTNANLSIGVRVLLEKVGTIFGDFFN